MTAFPDLHTHDRHTYDPPTHDPATPELLGQPRSRYQIDCAGATIHVHARSTATVLRIEGEVDASNADLIAEAVRRFARLRAPLVLDLGCLDFLAGSGLRALLVLNEEQQRAQLRCSVVSGAALRRLTRVVPDHGLPSPNQSLRRLRTSSAPQRRAAGWFRARRGSTSRSATCRASPRAGFLTTQPAQQLLGGVPAAGRGAVHRARIVDADRFARQVEPVADRFL